MYEQVGAQSVILPLFQIMVSLITVLKYSTTLEAHEMKRRNILTDVLKWTQFFYENLYQFYNTRGHHWLF